MGIYVYVMISVIVILGAVGIVMRIRNKENWKIAFLTMLALILILTAAYCSICDKMREQPYGMAFSKYEGYGRSCCQEHMKLWDWIEGKHTYPQFKE
jgi:hypothetical protein